MSSQVVGDDDAVLLQLSCRFVIVVRDCNVCLTLYFSDLSAACRTRSLRVVVKALTEHLELVEVRLLLNHRYQAC